MPGNGDCPLLGVDIRWSALWGEALRVKRAAFLGSIAGDRVVCPPYVLPYALLIVESPALRSEAVLPVSNRADFVKVWDALKVRGVRHNEECIVVHGPGRGLLRALTAALHVSVYPAGHLEQVYDTAFEPADRAAWSRPVANWG